MFKLSSLKLWDYEGNSYVYDFSYGLNYIQGKNDTGKTAFFHFLDYMLGDDSPGYRPCQMVSRLFA